MFQLRQRETAKLTVDELIREINQNFRLPVYRRKPARLFKADIEENFEEFINHALASSKPFYPIYTAFMVGAAAPTRWKEVLSKKRGIFEEAVIRFLKRRVTRKELVASDARRIKTATKVLEKGSKRLLNELVEFVKHVNAVDRTAKMKYEVCREVAVLGEKLWGNEFVKLIHSVLLQEQMQPGVVEGFAAGLSFKGLKIFADPWPKAPVPSLMSEKKASVLRRKGLLVDLAAAL